MSGGGPDAMTRAASTVAGWIPDRLLVRAIALTHRRFERELRSLDEILPPARRTAVDVGAWYGPWTHALARRFDHVVSLEPNPAVAGRLRGALPANVTLKEMAASDRNGSVMLYAPSALGAEGVGSLNDPGPEHERTAVQVRTTTIDSLGLRHVDFVKVDVEGHELEALSGAAETLARDRPVLVVELEERLAPVQPVFEFLDRLGYQPHVASGSGLVPLDPSSLRGATGVPRSYVAAVIRPDHSTPANNVVFVP